MVEVFDKGLGKGTKEGTDFEFRSNNRKQIFFFSSPPTLGHLWSWVPPGDIAKMNLKNEDLPNLPMNSCTPRTCGHLTYPLCS